MVVQVLHPPLKVASRVRHTGTRGETAKYSDNYIVESLTGMIVTRDILHTYTLGPYKTFERGLPDFRSPC